MNLYKHMINFQENKLIKYLLTVFVALYLVLPAFAFAQDHNITEERCNKFLGLFNIEPDPDRGLIQGGNFAAGLPKYCTVEEFFLDSVIPTLLSIAGIVAVIFIILGGFRYVSSAGNEETAEKAKKTLMYAIIGLVVVIMSFAIVRIVANTLHGGVGGGTSSENGDSGTGEGDGTGEGTGDENTDPGDNDVLNASYSIPDTVSPSGPLNVSALVSIRSEDALTNLCGGVPPTNCPVIVAVDGQTRGNRNFSRNPTQYAANISVPGPFVEGSTLTVSLKIAGSEVFSNSVQVSGQGSIDDPGPEDIRNAVSRTTYSVINNSGTVIVNLNLTGTDTNTICSTASDKSFKLYINGQLVKTETALTVRQFTVDMGATTFTSAGVKVCGYDIMQR